MSASVNRDRHQVGDQQVLDHVRGRELLAEAVDRRDQREEQRQDPGPPQREPPVGRAARAALLRARRRQRQRVHGAVAREREQHDRREGPARVDGHAAASVAAPATARPRPAACVARHDHGHTHCDGCVLIRRRPRRSCSAMTATPALAELLALVAPPACAACRAPLAAADRLLCPRVRAGAAVAARRAAARAAALPRHRRVRGCPAARRGVRGRLGAAAPTRAWRGDLVRRAEVPRRAAARRR